MLLTTALPSSLNMSATTTLAPSWAKRRAVAAPMPDAAPEIMATLSCKRMSVSLETISPILPPLPALGYQPVSMLDTIPWRHSTERFHGPSRLDLRHLPGPLPPAGREPDLG